MAKQEPYLVGDKWFLDVDPDDELIYVADVRRFLNDNMTTAESFTLVTNGVTVLEQGAPQGELNGLLPTKLKVSALASNPYCTFRTKTAPPQQQFDSTMWFKLVDK